jgi:hypothetical protein
MLMFWLPRVTARVELPDAPTTSLPVWCARDFPPAVASTQNPSVGSGMYGNSFLNWRGSFYFRSSEDFEEQVDRKQVKGRQPSAQDAQEVLQVSAGHKHYLTMCVNIKFPFTSRGRWVRLGWPLTPGRLRAGGPCSNSWVLSYWCWVSPRVWTLVCEYVLQIGKITSQRLKGSAISSKALSN